RPDRPRRSGRRRRARGCRVHGLLHSALHQQHVRGGGTVKRWQIVLLSFATLIIVVLGMYALFGSDGKNEAFQPQEEFRLHPWISIHIGGVDMSINRAVLYLFLAAALTCGTMI